jgi:hypothetical protein
MRSTPTDPDLDFLERTLRFQEGRLSPDEMSDFEHALRTDPHKRRLFIEVQERSLTIRNHLFAEDHQPLPTPRSVWSLRPLLSSPLWAAAAGLVMGLFSATLISKETSSAQSKPLLSLKLPLLDRGAPPTLGVPNEPGKWSGDYSEVVPAQDGITPFSGSRMLQIQRADHQGKIHPEGSRVGTVCYLVDLRPFRNPSASESLELRASVRFNSTADSAPETHDCSVSIHAVTAEFVSSGSLQNAVALIRRSLATASSRSPKIDVDPRTWQKVATELRIPPEADFALVSFNLAAPEPKDRKEIVHFQGKYMDDLQISLGRR